MIPTLIRPNFRFLLKFSLVWICFCTSTALSAQDYNFKIKSIGVEDGLTDRNVNVFFQDREGFMWFGTPFGLNRYDANRITPYTKENGNLLFNETNWIAEDGNGLLWIQGRDVDRGNKSLIQIFDPNSEISTRLEDFFDFDLPFDPERIIAIHSHHMSSDLWIVLENSVFRYQADFGHPIELIYQSNSKILHMAAGSDGLWLFEDQGFQLIDSSGNRLRTLNNYEGTSGEIFGIDAQSEIFLTRLSDDQKSFRIHYSGNPSSDIRLNLSKGEKLMGIDTHQGWIWKTDETSIFILDLQGNEVHRLELGFEIYAFPRRIYFDRFGNGWTNVTGEVKVFSLDKSKFKNFLTDITTFGTRGYGTRGLYVDGNNRLYTNGLGLSYQIDLATGEKKEFGPNENFYHGGGGDQGRFKRLALIEDQQGNLWYTDESIRVAKYDPQTGIFTDHSYSPDEYGENPGYNSPGEYRVNWSAHVDRNKRLWLGRLNGLAIKDDHEAYVHSFQNYGQYPELERASIYAFYENEKGIWIGSSTGLYLLNLSGEILQRFHSGGTNGNHLPFNGISHIREDQSGSLWLSSRGGGLIKVDPETAQYEQWMMKDGLSNNVLYASFEDDYGFIWVSSNKGIMRIALDGFSVSTYLQGDGLNHEEFNTGSYYQADDGRIFFGGINGVTMFHPKDFVVAEDSLADQRALDLRLVSLEKQQRSTGRYVNNNASLFEERKIQVYPNEVGFNLNFSLLDYVNSEYNTFSYKILGLDADWNYIDQPAIRINALPYGDYTLILRGQGPNGHWTNELQIPVKVIRPFYLRWWFYVLSVLTLVFAVLMIIRNRVKGLERNQAILEQQVAERTEQIREQAEELKQMDKVKSRFFANVSHELRTPLTLILGPAAKLLNRKGLDAEIEEDLKRIQRNGHGMSNLVEEILDLSKLDAKKLTIEKNATLVKEYFDVIFKNFLSHAKFKDIDYRYAYRGDEELTVLLDQRLTDRIVTNLLSNAFKFTSNTGRVELTVEESQHELKVLVSDTGVGISEKDLPYVFERYFQTKDVNKSVQGGTGIGLAMSKELSQLLDGDLVVESTINSGSIFTLTLPKEVYDRPHISIPIEEEAMEMAEEIAEIDTTKTRLLLVEDNLDMQDFIKQTIHDFHSIQCAGNGIEGLDLLGQDELPDIIISDMMMPEMDGLEFLKRVRADERTKDIPLLMLTARSAEEDKLEAFTLGVDDYQLKPFSVEELKARLNNLLRNAASRKQAVQEEESESAPDHSDSSDKEWLDLLKQHTEASIHEADFSIATVAAKVGLSERQLQRNLKKSTGLTPLVFVKEIQLQMARGYLEKKTCMQVKEVALAVGFTSAPYFSKLFHERFGKLPSEYLESKTISQI